MGQAKHKRGHFTELEKFKPGVVNIRIGKIEQSFWLDKDGKVFPTQLTKGIRVHDRSLIEFIHNSARERGMSLTHPPAAPPEAQPIDEVEETVQVL